MAEHGAIFGAMLEEFDGAARLLKLDPGIWRILTHPKRQIIVSCPVQMDNGEIEVFTGYRVQYNVTLGPVKGGIRYDPDVSLDEVMALAAPDVEVRRRALPFGGGQGRRRLRPEADVDGRARSAHPALHAEIMRRHRPGEGRAGARRQHRRAGDGVGAGHLQHAWSAIPRRRSSRASRSRWADRSDAARRPDAACMNVDAQVPRKQNGISSPGVGRGAGLRQRRIHAGRPAGARRRARSSRSATRKRRRLRRERHRHRAAGDYHARTASGLRLSRRRRDLSNEELLTCECDVLIPAAMENTITRRDRPARSSAKIVCEGANGPTTPEGGRDPAREAASRPARHPRQRRRRHGQLLRVGAGPRQLLLGRGSGATPPREEDDGGVRRGDAKAARRPTATTAPPPTRSRSAASAR